MAIQANTINLSTANPNLSGLVGRSYSKSYTGVPNCKLPALMLQELNIVYLALTGNDLDGDDNTIAVSSRDGAFYRLYAPKLYRGGHTLEDGTVTPPLYIRWGSARIPMIVGDNGIVPEFVGVGDYGVKTKFALFNPSGKGDDPCVEIKVTVKNGKDTTVYTLPISIAAIDYKGYKADVFTAAAESGDLEEVTTLLTVEPSGKGGGNNGVTVKRKDLLTAVFGSPNEQTRALTFKVTGVKSINASHGPSFILSLEASDDAELISRWPEAAAPFNIFPDGRAKTLLLGQPDINISATKPATLIIPVKDSMLLQVDSDALKTVGGVQLDF